MHTYLQRKAIALNYADFAKLRPECKAFYKAFADAVITLGGRYVAQEHPDGRWEKLTILLYNQFYFDRIVNAR
jgi:hypothetical protein